MQKALSDEQIKDDRFTEGGFYRTRFIESPKVYTVLSRFIEHRI